MEQMRMTQRQVVAYEENEEEDDDAAELSGWGTADFDATTLLPTGAHEPTRFTAANARKKEQRRRRDKEMAALAQEDVVHLFHSNNNTEVVRRDKSSSAQVSPPPPPTFKTTLASRSNNNTSKTALLAKEFAVSGCAVPTPNFIRVTKALSPLKRKFHRRQQQQHTQQAASLNRTLCKIVGLIEDHDGKGSSDPQPWRPTPLAVRKGAENVRLPSLVSSTSVDALLSQHFRSDLEKKLRALPVPFGTHPIDQSSATTTSFLPSLVYADTTTPGNNSNKQDHVLSMRRRRQNPQQQQPSLSSTSHRDAHVHCVRDLMAFPATC